MGTQSESRNVSTFRLRVSKTLRGTREANSAFDIFSRKKHVCQPTARDLRKSPVDVAVEVRFFVASSGYATHRDRKLSASNDVFAPGARHCEARRGRDGANTGARSVGSRGEAGGGAGHAGARLGGRRVVPREAGKRTSAVRVTSASDVGRPWRARPPTRCTSCSWMTTASRARSSRGCSESVGTKVRPSRDAPAPWSTRPRASRRDFSHPARDR